MVIKRFFFLMIKNEIYDQLSVNISGMASEGKTKNISESEDFENTFNKLCYVENLLLSPQTKCELVTRIFSLLNVMKIWLNNPKYIKFKPSVINKAYEMLGLSKSSLIKAETSKEAQITIHATLELACCNKIINGRYCTMKKIGQYCTFHTNIKNRVLECLIEETESHIIKDVSDIVCEYISL